MPIDTSMYRAYAPQVFTATQRLEAEAAKRLREAEMAQRNRLMELQISAAQDTARETALQRAERVAAQERMRNALAMLPSPEMRASQNALAGGGGPTVANAAGMRPVDPRASMLYQLAQADQSYIPKYLETLDPNFGREEVKQFIETQGGRVGVNRFGDTTGNPIPFAPDVQMVNLGGRTVAVDRRAVAPGTAFDVTMTHAEQSAAADRAAARSLAERRFAFDQQTARASQAGAVAEAGGPGQAALTAQYGKAPPGFRWKPDGALEAIPGGPSDIKAGAEGEKREKRKQSLITQANSVLDTIADAKSLVGVTTAGLGGMSRVIPATDARNLSAKLETIKANLGFDRLQQMRDESPTGGALGQVAVQELTALQSTVASLDQLQSPTQLKAALDKIEGHYNRWLEVMGQPRKSADKSSATLDTESLYKQADAIIKGR